MLFALHVLLIMSSAFFNPSFAFSSHFDTDGAPLSELSWPSSLAVVAVSFSGLFTFVFLMLACLCCKKGDVGFKEFENTEGDEYQADLSTLASPSSQNGPDVYVLPLTEVSLPVAKQPQRSIQLLKSSALGRHSLLYLREIGDGWFGKVLLGEVHEGLSTTQVVVKELKASASVQEQMQFLEEVQPYRKLQHAALLLCLAQCSEVTPYLLIMEFCPLGDVKSYLCSCRAADSETPDPMVLQQMACDIASGLLHLHKYNFVHSDLALRNCLLTADMSVKIGDYGLSHSRFKEDYYITQDQIWVPLRWIAPELIDEVHGNLLVVDQTRSSNIWSLGVTMWELFELGHQPYQLYSDRQVLMYTVKEQQLKLSKPQLQFCLAERWYEVMQFCWLQPELRPSSEEVHLLITYLCAKGSSEAEEDFEKRWNALRPNLLGSASHTAASTALILTPKPAATDALGTEQNQAMELSSSASSSFPLLEHFSDSFHSDPGDDLLTVTETSHGLNFEYKWEQARAEQPYCSSLTSGPLGQGNPHYQDIYYCSRGNSSGGCKKDGLGSGISPSYYESEHPGVVPVLSAHSPSVGSEYYIRIEEAAECSLSLDDGVVDSSISVGASIDHPSPATAQPKAYWSAADKGKSSGHGSDSSPAVHLTVEPLATKLSCSSPAKYDPSHKCHCSYQTDAEAREQEATNKTGQESSLCVLGTSPECQSKLLQPAGRSDSPNSLSQAVSSPGLGFCDPYLEARTLPNGSCHNMAGPLRKAVPIISHISIEVETDDGLMLGQWRSNTDSTLFSERESTNWSSNHSANNNSLSFDSRQKARDLCSYLDLQCDAHSRNSQLGSLSEGTTMSFHASSSAGTLEAAGGRSAAHDPTQLDSHIHLCHRQREAAQNDVNPGNCISSVFRSITHYSENGNRAANSDSLLKGERLSSQPKMIPEAGCLRSPSSFQGPQRCQRRAPTHRQTGKVWDKGLVYPVTPQSSTAALHESGVGLSELGDYSEDDDDNDDDDDDDIKEITSGIFADFNLDYSAVEEEELTLLKNPEGTPESVDTLNISSALLSPCDQGFSPDPFNAPVLPKSLDSGYETENHESPEFSFKELGDPACSDGARLGEEAELLLQTGLGRGIGASGSPTKLQLKGLSQKNPYRDSAYFSDFEAECERSPQAERSQFFDDPTIARLSHREGDPIKSQLTREQQLTCLRHNKSCVLEPSSPHHICTPGLSMLSPFPPQMGGCLTKESAADDDLEFETEPSGEEPRFELSSSASSDSSSASQDSSDNKVEGNKRGEDCCSSANLASDCRNEGGNDRESRSVEDEEDEEDELPEFNKVEEAKEDSREGPANNEEDFADIDADECDSLCEESNGPVDFSPSSSLLELCGEEVRAPLEEAEDEESDDSESDEELRTYNIQDEESEGSEQDFSAVPVVVSNSSESQHLRSLLKMPPLMSDSFCNELERKKKAVSFFDDVTVFLFDQESPTGELADFSTCPGVDACAPQTTTGNLCDPQPPPPETCRDSGEADAADAEEGGSWEWAEQLGWEAGPPSPDVAPQASSPTESRQSPEPASVALTRFMVSRFSITHISDPKVATPAAKREDLADD